jgi:hypothetical protein
MTDIEPAFLPKNLDLLKRVDDFVAGRKTPVLPKIEVSSGTKSRASVNMYGVLFSIAINPNEIISSFFLFLGVPLLQ